MTRVFEVLFLEHDVRLVLLAAVVCAFGAVTTMNVSSRAAGPQRTGLWLALLSLCAGSTVWATHFIAMLAYMQDVATTYEPLLTMLSFVSGVVVMGLGFAIGIRGGRTQPAKLVGGAVVGVGVIVLHYVGMAAMQMPGELTYAPSLVIASVILSIGFGAPALLVGLQSEAPYARPVGALLMVLMIVSLHFTAMGAVQMHMGMAGASLADGVSRSVLASAVAIASVSVLIIGLACALIDQRVSHRLAAEADRFRTLAEGAFEGLVVHRDGNIMDSNSAARRMLGLSDDASAQAIASCFGKVLASPPTGQDPSMAVEVELQRADGSTFPAEICRRSIQLPGQEEGELCAIRDLTSRKEAEARIAHLALHDPLTDLPNRRFFMELAQKAISRAHRTDDRFALLALDLDDFKVVNDEYGHAGGDELIRAAAQRISASLREADVGARFGGDEFAVLQVGASQPSHAIALAERLLESLTKPVELEYGEVSVTASIGIAVYPDDGDTAEALLRSADTAMYRAKADGKATTCFFEPHMDAALLQRRKLEHGLRRALADGKLAVAYQPIVESQSRRPLGFEALVRWYDEELGFIPPAEFIPVAEETGLIVPIAEFVVRQACRDAMTWPEHLRVAVNLSAVQFRRKGLVEMVRSALQESGLPGERLDLEITETMLVDNRQETLRLLNELKDLGVRISMDDFGTGYSALSYLQSFPFDKIKIDRVFVADLGQNPQNASIVRAVAAMGRSLHMRVVAEGVETDHEADILQDLECDEIQGYLIAKPMPADDVESFLSRHEEIPVRALRLG